MKRKRSGDRLTPDFAKRVETPGRYGDGRGSFGLSLLVRPTSSGLSKTYQQTVTVQGRKKYFGLGPTTALTLKQARELAASRAMALRAKYPRPTEFDKLMAAQLPVPTPLQQQALMDSPPVIPTFAEEAEAMIEARRESWKPGSRTEHNRRNSLSKYAFPAFGEIRIDQVTANSVQQMLEPLWHEKPAQAVKLFAGVSGVFDYALGRDHIAASPMERVKVGLGPQRKGRGKNQRSVPYQQVKAAIEHYRASGSYLALRLAAEFQVLTAARPGEVAGATWGEIDKETAEWVIPAHRMKEEQEHRVPLSKAAQRLVYYAEAKLVPEYHVRRADPDTPLFPALKGGGVKGDTILQLLQRGKRFNGTSHGFRSTFRNWAAEQTDFPREIAEAALSHKVGSQVERAYLRTTFFDKRRELMDLWGDYCTGGDYVHDEGYG